MVAAPNYEHVFTAKTMVGGWRGALWRMTSCVRSSVRQSLIRSVAATRWPTAASAHSGNRNYLQSWARDNLIALQQRQCDNVIELQRQEQIWKMIRSRCLDGVAKTNRVLMQELTTLWRDNMVAVLSRAQLCLLYICSLSERVIVMASILEILPCKSCNKFWLLPKTHCPKNNLSLCKKPSLSLLEHLQCYVWVYDWVLTFNPK